MSDPIFTSLTVTGPAAVDGGLRVGTDIAAANTQFFGNLSINRDNGGVGGSLNAAGGLTADSLRIQGTTIVAGAALEVAAGGLSVTGPTTLNSGLSVTGPTTLSGGLTLGTPTTPALLQINGALDIGNNRRITINPEDTDAPSISFEANTLSFGDRTGGAFVSFHKVFSRVIKRPTKFPFETTPLLFRTPDVVYVKNLIVEDKLSAPNKAQYVTDQFFNKHGAALEQGDVVVIAADQSGLGFSEIGNVPVPEVDLASQAYDTCVCGVVAEAYDSEASDRTSVGPDQVGSMVTLGTYAYCKVDADIAPIVPGDLLTTSPTPGHAQKVLDRNQATGTILGKALGALASGQGKIPVFVSCQ